MKYRACLTSIAVLIGSVCPLQAWPAQRQESTQKMAHDIFKQLIEINTTDSIGSTTAAAQAMAQRLLDAGFRDGYYYGRGTQDMKASDAIIVTDFIRLKQERFTPDRDIILALTADEEGGTSNGVDWLLKKRGPKVVAGCGRHPDHDDVGQLATR